jgi:hypothetical protein
MDLTLQTLCQIQRTASSSRYVTCGPGHIQCSYSSAYSGFNIQQNVSVLLVEISRRYSEPYAANMVPNTAHTLQFTLYELWSRPYTMYLQLHIFRIQYLTQRISAVIGDMSTIQRTLYCKLCAKYSAHTPDYAIWTVIPAIYNVFTAPHIQDSILNSTYLRRYWRYVDNPMDVILQTLCQIQHTYSSLSYLNCGPGHILCNYSSTYSGFNILLNVSPPLSEINRQMNGPYSANFVPNTAHIVQIALCVLWCRTYTM